MAETVNDVFVLVVCPRKPINVLETREKTYNIYWTTAGFYRNEKLHFFKHNQEATLCAACCVCLSKHCDWCDCSSVFTVVGWISERGVDVCNCINFNCQVCSLGNSISLI